MYFCNHYAEPTLTGSIKSYRALFRKYWFGNCPKFCQDCSGEIFWYVLTRNCVTGHRRTGGRRGAISLQSVVGESWLFPGWGLVVTCNVDSVTSHMSLSHVQPALPCTTSHWPHRSPQLQCNVILNCSSVLIMTEKVKLLQEISYI